MTAPTEVVEELAEPIVEAPREIGEIAVRFPVIAVEQLDTADGRFISADALTARPTPLTVLAQSRAAHGGQPPPAAYAVGRIDTLERVPGPEVISGMTGQPFPEGVWVWRGTGTIDGDAMVEGRPIGDLLRRRYLRFISADLVPSDYEMFGDGNPSTMNPDEPTRRAVVHKADLAGLTIIPVSAFGDCTVELIDDEAVLPAEAEVDVEELGLAASAFPSWRSVEVGDTVSVLTASLVAAGEVHTGGMIALVPANPEELTVEGGEPAEEIHLTLAYLGEDVTEWGEDERAAVLDHVRGWAADTQPIEADVMGWALFNPTGANDREPCAVHLVSGAGLPDAKGAMGGHDTSEHPVFLPHMTAGYGVPVDALSFIGPITFDRVRVALAGESEVFELGSPPVDSEMPDEGEVPAMAADDMPDLPDIETVDEVGMPDAPQPCEMGDEPAVRSLLFSDPDGDRYAATCDEHEADARARIEADGGEVTGVVDIVQPDTDDAEEIPA